MSLCPQPNDAFCQDEIHILQSLGGNLVFGIDVYDLIVEFDAFLDLAVEKEILYDDNAEKQFGD